ncbi:hypothetical protein M404DRAFT_542856 [Pisolithus tinctorius Marx 270]|uniref:Uncharacterized protein n=1 Tax=Pisolithus tinctorius Marx 270 TaxID=870435 RepID=A0A0C3J616_PISTI|nr:hypothetical protein M404DRAFT_542856 [Pisolithus tinctorius Marx 270]
MLIREILGKGQNQRQEPREQAKMGRKGGCRRTEYDTLSAPTIERRNRPKTFLSCCTMYHAMWEDLQTQPTTRNTPLGTLHVKQDAHQSNLDLNQD